MAGVRNVRTKEQKINDLKTKLAKVKSDMRDETKKADDRRAIIIGKSLQDRASRDKDAKQLLDAIIAGLVRDQDRKMFDLDPLPKPEPDAAPVDPVAQPAPAAPPASRPSPSERANALSDRLDRAVTAWKAGPQTLELKAELAAVVVEYETLTGKLFTGMAPEARASFGLGQSPGERL
jgi:hypothetical protein